MIENHEKLTELFGHWPSFHDVEVIDLHFWRGLVAPGGWDDRNVFPVLTIKLVVLQDSETTRDVLTTLRFHDVGEFKMEGFNHMNQIIEFNVQTVERGTFLTGERLPPFLIVSFERGFGMAASFRCFRIEVLDAVPYTSRSGRSK